MSDLREPLEREARRIHVAPDALDKIHARTHSRQRTHRLVSGLVALTVAATGILVAVRTFTPTGEGGGARPAYQPPGEGRLPVWPSFGAGGGDVAAIDAIQQRVDEGHQPGYLSPEIVAQMFAMEVLEWERSDFEANVQGDDPTQVAISNPTLDGQLADVRTILTLERWRGHDDGIYVIMTTDTEILDLRSPKPGQDVRGAEKLTFEGSLEGISQRLLELHLTFDIEGASSSASQGQAGSITFEPAARPTASGAFEATVAMPEAPPAPGISVFVRSSELRIAVEAFRLGSAESTLVTPTLVGKVPANYRLIHDSSNPQSRLAVLLISAADLLFRPEANNIRILIEPGREDLTRIFSPPHLDLEAGELRDKIFEGAEIQTMIPGGPHDLRIELGRDFANRYPGEIKALAHVDSFMVHRYEGSEAEKFLHAGALARYERSEDGLSLYGYMAAGDYHIAEIRWVEDVIEVGVVILRGEEKPLTEVFEVGRVSDPGIEGGRGLAILDVRRGRP